MTTIIDPAGSPTIVFRSNDPVFYGADASGSDETDAALLPIYSSRTVVLVTSDSSGKGVKISGEGVIGDTLDIHGNSGSLYNIYKPNGDLLGAQSAGRRLTLTPNGWV